MTYKRRRWAVLLGAVALLVGVGLASVILWSRTHRANTADAPGRWDFTLTRGALVARWREHPLDAPTIQAGASPESPGLYWTLEPDGPPLDSWFNAWVLDVARLDTARGPVMITVVCLWPIAAAALLTGALLLARRPRATRKEVRTR